MKGKESPSYTGAKVSMKEAFRYNSNGVKSSADQYRNINGTYYKCWTCNNSIFEEEKQKAKELGLKCRIIKGELYREVKQSGEQGDNSGNIL